MSDVFKKILIVSLIAVALVTLASIANLGAGMFSVIILPILLLVVGLILLATKEKQWAKVFLISAGIVLLLGFSVCTAAFMMGDGLNMH